MENIICAYEEVLKTPDNNKGIPKFYFENVTPSYCESEIVKIVRYAIENLLYFTPREAFYNLTYDMLEKLKIKDYVDKYICFPIGLPESDRIKYLVHKCYPTNIKFNYKYWVETIFKEIIISEDDASVPVKDKKIFPKKFFNDRDGLEKACFCLGYLIKLKSDVICPNGNIEELYEFFANTRSAQSLLKKYKLQHAERRFFGLDTLSYLHATLGDSGNNFLYTFYQFNADYKHRKNNSNANDETDDNGEMSENNDEYN